MYEEEAPHQEGVWHVPEEQRGWGSLGVGEQALGSGVRGGSQVVQITMVGSFVFVHVACTLLSCVRDFFTPSPFHSASGRPENIPAGSPAPVPFPRPLLPSSCSVPFISAACISDGLRPGVR